MISVDVIKIISLHLHCEEEICIHHRRVGMMAKYVQLNLKSYAYLEEKARNCGYGYTENTVIFLSIVGLLSFDYSG